MDPETLPLSLGNAVLFLAALFGFIASFSRPIQQPGDSQPQWDRWDMSFLNFLFLLWIVFLIILFAPFAGVRIAGIFPITEGYEDQVLSVCATVIMQAGLVLLVLYAIHRRGWSFKEFFRSDGVTWRQAFLHSGHLFLRFLPLVWLVALFWGGLLIGLQELGVPIEMQPQTAVTWIAESDSTIFLIVMGLIVVFGAPLSEELIFRGVLYRFLSEKGSARLALILSGILFALLHASLNSFLPLCFIGLLLAKIYEDTRDIRTPIFFHLFFNLFSFLQLLCMP